MSLRPVDAASLIAEGFSAKAWHGPNLRSALRGVGVDEALWRAAPGRHCIWELALHCAYWKHRVIVRVSGERTRFPRPGANFPRLPVPADTAAWRADRELLEHTHERLVELVRGLTVTSLEDSPPRLRKVLRPQLVGIAFHDIYHAGQVRLLRRLFAQRAG